MTIPLTGDTCCTECYTRHAKAAPLQEDSYFDHDRYRDWWYRSRPYHDHSRRHGFYPVSEDETNNTNVPTVKAPLPTFDDEDRAGLEAMMSTTELEEEGAILSGTEETDSDRGFEDS